MPRVARKDIYTNYIHLIVQGINKEYIFKKDEWKEEYIKIIQTKIKNTNIKIMAYCIMDNHAHFLVYYTKIEELSELMKKVNTTYAMRYNTINKRKGFVFRDRYYTQSILNKKQLYNCLVYIHRNPINAQICNEMENYKYSSYNEYIKERRIIDKDSCRLIFGTNNNYKDNFEFIHRNKEKIEDIKEIIEYQNIKKETISKYKKQINESLNNNEEIIGELLLEIRHKYGVSLREMSKMFSINKDKLNKYIHKVIDDT